ncbi:uncharacterized protein BT62DRAFT_925339 [Guyanagaster necrorhizus]|uniref:Fe2OG dioxygenase domain-containing protein n=1 Tax=Guyanagaster necrorhizus TaxID=856835 RepID=A0A9P7W7M5_9AGAR|nr:uncharacterized protein BT62DRAFT_925339 [Guyanagaster necrorhizus MCA 3950]KAG7452801.1 hypothetical protein BT62DRAFT_925339 [Guyanagaster necrorhizus MCA 3950]
MSTDDTEMLIALVYSLLQSNSRQSEEAVLDALVQHNGNVEAAAQYLNNRGKKRKRTNDLTSWLGNKPNKIVKRDDEDDMTLTRKSPSTSKPSSSSKKPAVNLMTVLRQAPPSPSKKPVSPPPLLLSNPAMVEQHSPCTMHLSVLPHELACRLFYTMVDASRGWGRNKWWLFDRLVESPHRTSFFARENGAEGSADAWQEAARFWYNGRMTEPPLEFPASMEEACVIVERLVNEELRKRQRFPLEWAGQPGLEYIWRANVAASNCYEGAKECVGPHSDQMTYLGPYCTIASLSLGARRIFSLREVIPKQEKETRSAQTFNIPLPHNSLTIMHASCQERFKHSIPPQSSMDLYRPSHPRVPNDTSNCRINITFRFYRPDFHPSSIPRCKCDVPTILRPDMKNRTDGKTDKYWWTCYAGAQNEGKGCDFWNIMDMEKEGRGPVVGETTV